MWKVISWVMTAVVQCKSSVGGSPIIAALRTPPDLGVSWAMRGPAKDTVAARISADMTSARRVVMAGLSPRLRGRSNVGPGYTDRQSSRARRSDHEPDRQPDRQSSRPRARPRRRHAAGGRPLVLAARPRQRARRPEALPGAPAPAPFERPQDVIAIERRMGMNDTK